MTSEDIKKLIASLDEQKRFDAMSFWQRIYDTAIAQSIHDSAALPLPTGAAQGISSTAAQVADNALRHWAERW